MALAAKETRMTPGSHNGIVQFNDEYRPSPSERKKYKAQSTGPGVLRDLEDATIHLVGYYKHIDHFIKNSNNKSVKNEKVLQISPKELALTAYNRGITNVKSMLIKGHDPRTYRLPNRHKNYALEILRLSSHQEFLKVIQ